MVPLSTSWVTLSTVALPRPSMASMSAGSMSSSGAGWSLIAPAAFS